MTELSNHGDACASVVQTGDCTMMSYVVKPLQDQLMRAFREK